MKYYLTKMREMLKSDIQREMEKEHRAGLRKLLLRVESKTVDEIISDSDVTSGSCFGYT